jgi:Cys-rich protein (TIGR01571 family)
MSWFCPCSQYAFNAQKIDGSSWCGSCCLYCVCLSVGCHCLIHASKRTTMRYNYGLTESCCCDCCVAYTCSCCALAQEHRELTMRGPPPPRQVMTSPTAITVINTAQPQQMQPQYMISPHGQMIPVQQTVYPQAVYPQYAQPSPMSPGQPPMYAQPQQPIQVVASVNQPNTINGTMTHTPPTGETIHNYAGEGQTPMGGTMQ